MMAKHINFNISNVGLVINKTIPCFGASPDSLVKCDCCGEGCVEVKCPFCVRDTTVEELAALKNTCLKHVQLENGVLGISLDHKHAYYYQIQMQMAITGRQYCDFVVWSKHSFFIERVYFNEQFWLTESHIAKYFFYKAVMPELLGKYFTNEKIQIAEVTTVAEIPDNFTISPSCSYPSASGTLCKCRKPNDGLIISCSNTYCSIKWYHLTCTGMKKLPISI